MKVNRKRKNISQFTQRKEAHINLALKEKNAAFGFSGFSRIQLLHSALPEIDFSQVDISTSVFGKQLATPFVVTGMTGGWEGALAINKRIASVCEKRGWVMGIGSQRRQIFDSLAGQEAKSLRKSHPHLLLMGNIGLTQLIQTDISVVEKLADSLSAQAMVVHTNPLQEALQPEGTPQFQGGLEALHRLCQKCSVPVILKETGCGFSQATLQDLSGIGLFAVDVSGYGGTHWGRIEGDRMSKTDPLYGVAEAFQNWGISTVDSLLSAREVPDKDYEVWASGGIQNGCEAAKALALGASRVGVARLAITATLQDKLDDLLACLEHELKTALFCLGCKNIKQLQKSKTKKWKMEPVTP